MSETSLLWVAVLGLPVSVLIERTLHPHPPLQRPRSGWWLHIGIWWLGLAVLDGLTARPLFSAVNELLVWALIVAVSNAKYHSLREPFVCADFEYFSDALRFPRLYLPFFGIAKAMMLALGFGVYLWAGLAFETARPAPALATLLGLAGLLLVALGHHAQRRQQPLSFDAAADIRQQGFIACLWGYFWAARTPVDHQQLGSPFSLPTTTIPAIHQPDLVSIQSESFFDVRNLWPGIKHSVLHQYDELRAQAMACGPLHVAAWGANTVRSEFAYLTGIPDQRLGVHRFNPYRVLARQGLPSIAAYLKAQGYRTVCIHPYHSSFYARDKVMPALGFDEFIDIRSFHAAQKVGPFIGDGAVADYIQRLLQAPQPRQPLFIHAITMENHGPLHLEHVAHNELATWFDRPLLDGMDDLAPYLRHIANADRMLGQLSDTLRAHPNEALLCFFGDHVPILPNVYQAVGTPLGHTDYLIWSNRHQPGAEPAPLAAEALASRLLDCATRWPQKQAAR